MEPSSVPSRSMWKLPACFETAVVCMTQNIPKTFYLILQELIETCISKQAIVILDFAPWLATQLGSLEFLDSIATQQAAEQPQKLP